MKQVAIYNSLKRWSWTGLAAVALVVGLALAGCGGQQTPTASNANKQAEAPAATTGQPAKTETAKAKLAGKIEIDGSSTVYPITEAVAEEFLEVAPAVQVTVGVSGTGGGFKRFVVGETDISDASRPIKKEEAEKASANGIQYIEMPIAFDGITVVVNPQNDWANNITVAELKKLWEPESKITRWNQLRPEWPDQPIKLFGPGTDSGTFEYFTEEIVGKAKSSRSDYTGSEDDNTLVYGVAGDKYALGYFGFAYYQENTSKLKALQVDAGSGPVAPSLETINNNTYSPLSRPIFIYVSKKALERPEVKEFVVFYNQQAPKLISQVGYVAMAPKQYQDNLNKVK